MKGLIHVYHGDGKGKTTAAVGLCVRSAGCGNNVSFAQFLKGGETGEINILKNVDKVSIFRNPKRFGFFRELTEADKIEIRKIHDEILEDAFQNVKDGGLIILDEILHAINFNLVDEDKLKECLENRNETVEVVFTGRNPKEWVLEVANYVSEIKKIKHPYDEGIPAREGVEY